MSAKQNIVVVGGGGAGIAVAQGLSQKLDSNSQTLTVVTARPFFVLLPAALRMLTTSEGNLEETALISYDKAFPKGNATIKVGRVVSVEAKEGKGGVVVLENGERVPYDVLVLAPGSHWPGPVDFPDTREGIQAHLKEWRGKFGSAKGVVLAGGGAVGIELAGELKDAYPDKKVTLVHADSQLLNKAYPNKFRKRIEKDLRPRDVQIVFSDYVDDFDVVPVVTRNGKKLEGDLVIPTVGNRPATEFLASLGSEVLNERGQIRVKPTLQLKGHPEIFALGDAIDWDEQKQLAKYQKHGEIVAANVLAYLKGVTPSKEYTGSPELIIITNGKAYGAGYIGMLGGFVLGNWFASMVKGKSLMVPMVRKSFNQS
ncbi:FAD/NAD-P-binding domain-containing protein [Amylostereum chailletii]|nr:FAD/NAD-P-binding domain-containing protein [Amylostereum chailletii]